MGNKITISLTYKKQLIVGISLIGIGIYLYLSQLKIAGATFALIGFFVFGYRQLCTINFENKSVISKKTTFGIPLYKIKWTKLDSVKHVEVKSEYRKPLSSGGSVQKYEVFVTYLMGSNRIPVKEHRNFGRARVFSEKLAKRLNIPLVEKTTGNVVKRKPGEVDMCLGQRLRHRGKSESFPTQSNNSDIKTLSDGSDVILRFPAQPLELLGYVIMFGLPIIVSSVLWVTGHYWVIWALILPIFLIILSAGALSLFPSFLIIEKNGILIKHFYYRKRIPFSKLEDVVNSGLDILLVTDQKRTGLSYDFHNKDDANYVTSLIKYYSLQHESSFTTV